MEGFKNNNDGLDFICEICGDREGGCPACGFGGRQVRENSKEQINVEDLPATKEDLDQFFREMKDITREDK